MDICKWQIPTTSMISKVAPNYISIHAREVLKLTLAYPSPNIDAQSHCQQAMVLSHQRMCCSTICQIEQCGGSDGHTSVLAAIPSCCC